MKLENLFLALPLSLRFLHHWLQLDENSKYQGWELYKVKDWKWIGLLTWSWEPLGYASMCFNPLACCCFSLRLLFCCTLTVRGRRGTAVEVLVMGGWGHASSRLLTATELWQLGAWIWQCLSWQQGEEPASQANCFNPEQVAPSLSEQRRGAEACYIAVLMEQVSLPLLSWEQHQEMILFLVLCLIDRELQVLSLSNWLTCPGMLG